MSAKTANRKPKRPDPSTTVLGPDFLAGSASGGLSLESASNLAAYSVAMLDTAVNNASFKIPARATVRTGAAPQKVAIVTTTLPADLRYRATPKRLETAFLAAEASNTTDFPLLAGMVSTFVDNTFVADGSLKTVMPGERLTLEFGADQSLAVQRKLVSKFTENAGLTGKTKRITYDLLITVTNHKRTAERIDLAESVPMSRDENITVRLLAPAERDLLKPEDAAAQPPKLGVARDAEGKLTWRLDLKPGEKRELPLKFSIEHPADLPVVGVE